MPEYAYDMRCISPLTIRNPSNSKEFISVPCGKCVYCRMNKANAWAYRLRQERKSSVCSYFLTLTYSDEHLTYNDIGNPILVREDVTKFLKRFRFYLDKVQVKVRYYGCGEYGGETARPHYHVLLFFDKLIGFDQVSASIYDAWQMGLYELSAVNDQRIHYTCKYMVKQVDFIEELDLVKPFSFMSRRPAIGYALLDNPSVRRRVRHDANMMIFDDRHYLWLPRYYQLKLLPTNCPSNPENCSPKTHAFSKFIKNLVQGKIKQLLVNEGVKEEYEREKKEKKYGEGVYFDQLLQSQMKHMDDLEKD